MLNRFNCDKKVLFLILGIGISWNLNAQTGKDYALFFSVTDFDYWSDFPLSSHQQISQIESELKDQYGFTTEMIKDPKRSQILNKLTQYHQKKFGPNDQLLIYFSMHGQYQEGGTGALIPKDGKLNDPTYDTWIIHPIIEDLVNRIPCQHILIALDACYSGTFGSKYKNKPNKPAWETKKDCSSKRQNALQYKSRLYLTSGGIERTPTDSEFADKWLEALRLQNSDGLLGFHELFGVLTEAQPKPRFGDFRGHIKGGDFVFLNESLCAPSAALTDTDHWQSLNGTTKRKILADHLGKYPNCIHQSEIFRLLGGVTSSIQDPSELPEAGKSKHINEERVEIPNMIYVQGGNFQMGSNDGGSDEKPIHKVTLNDYYLSKYEITNSEFAFFLNEYGNPTIGGTEIYELESSYAQIEKVNGRFQPKPGMEQHPVVEVSWYGAVVYCNWRSETDGLTPVYAINGDQVTAYWQANGFRLPTEAEWEYAARSRGGNNKWAGTSSESQLSKFGNFCDKNCTSSWKTEGQNDGYENTAPIGNYESNGLGLHDMSGNVWEWCWDWYGDYPPSDQTNPRGAKSGSYRVIRGGSWFNKPAYLRCAYRYNNAPGNRSYSVGFRLSRAVR